MTGLIGKIAMAALEVGGKLSTDKTNTEQRYDYLSADKILSVCGQALVAQGVVVMPEVVGYDLNVVDRGNSKVRYDCRVDFIFVVSDGETTHASKWYGMGSDYTVPDKALYKAITSGHKYFLMKLLCIGAGNEDGEHEGGEPQQKPRVNLSPNRAQPPTRNAHTTPPQAWPDPTNGKPAAQPAQYSPAAVINGQAVVQTVVGYITKEQWDEHAEGLANAADQRTDAEKVADETELVYTGLTAKVGGHKYPAQWAKMAMAHTHPNKFEIDGILQKLRLPQATAPEAAMDAVTAYLAQPTV